MKKYYIQGSYTSYEDKVHGSWYKAEEADKRIIELENRVKELEEFENQVKELEEFDKQLNSAKIEINNDPDAICEHCGNIKKDYQ